MSDSTPEHEASRDERSPSLLSRLASNAVAAVRADEDQLALLRAYERLDPLAIEKLTPEEARRQPTAADAVHELLREQGRSAVAADLVPGVTTDDRTIRGATGQLPVRMYWPDGVGPFPVIVFFHGGGWVIADKDVYDASARGLSDGAAAIVVSIDYRLAPEHKFPAAWDDAVAAYAWVAEHAADLGGDPSRLALAGESAGGTLAVATAIAARDAGLAQPRHVLAIYPVAQTSLNTESYLENAVAKPLNRAMMGWFFDHVTRSNQDLENTRLNLVNADLSGLPPVTIINARLDPLRSDGAQLAEALVQAGTPVERREYAGVAHEFFGASAVLEKAREAQAFAAERLREAFAS